jgi:hypothetical protein
VQGGGAYLLDLAILVDITAIDTLELKVAGDLGVEQDLHLLSVHQKEDKNTCNCQITVTQ